jgi:hypothetical protein
MPLPETFGSAAGTSIREDKWEQLGKSLGMEPAAVLPTLAVGRQRRTPFVTQYVNVRLRQLV